MKIGYAILFSKIIFTRDHFFSWTDLLLILANIPSVKLGYTYVKILNKLYPILTIILLLYIL